MRDTVIHVSAEAIASADSQREGAAEQRAARERMAKDKTRILLDLRSEHRRQVAAAVAAKTGESFSQPREKNATIPAVVAGADGGGFEPVRVVDATKLPAPLPPQPSPSPVGTTRLAAPAAAVDEIIQRVGEKVVGSAPNQPLSPGLFALVLIGLFLVPSSGIALLLLGIAHLRGHRFLSGSVIIALGCLFLWGTWSLARTANPELFTGASHASRDRAAPADFSTMQAIPTDVLWSED